MEQSQQTETKREEVHIHIACEGSATVARAQMPGMPEPLVIATTACALHCNVPGAREAFQHYCGHVALTLRAMMLANGVSAAEIAELFGVAAPAPGVVH